MNLYEHVDKVVPKQIYPHGHACISKRWNFRGVFDVIMCLLFLMSSALELTLNPSPVAGESLMDPERGGTHRRCLEVYLAEKRLVKCSEREYARILRSERSRSTKNSIPISFPK